MTDKAGAAKSSYVSRPAVADRSSALHYSKLGLAANDNERSLMKTLPFLPALATLMYTVHFTNPHLNYNTSFLGQFMHVIRRQPAWMLSSDLSSTRTTTAMLM